MCYNGIVKKENAMEYYFEIEEVMLNIGLQPKYHGFQYLRDCVRLFFKKPVIAETLTVEIYPEVAKMHEVSPSAIERDIRITIKDAFKTKGLLNINKYYDEIVFEIAKPPSNGEIIAIIAELVKLERLKNKLKVLSDGENKKIN